MVVFEQLDHADIRVVISIDPLIIDISHLQMSVHFYYHFESHFVVQLVYLVLDPTIPTVSTFYILQSIFRTYTSLPVHIPIYYSIHIHTPSTHIFECLDTYQLVLAYFILYEISYHVFYSDS